MAGNNDHTTQFNADISGLRAAMREAQQQVRLANSEFAAASSRMEDWAHSTDGLNAKISQLTTVLNAEQRKLQLLSEEYALVAAEQGANSQAARELQIRINQQRTTINQVRQQLTQYTNNLQDLQQESNQSESALDQLTNSISDQKKELQKAKDDYASLVLTQGETSDEAQQLAARIRQLSGDINSNEETLRNARQAADEFDDTLDDVDESTEETGNSFGILDGVISNFVANALTALVSKVGEAITAMATLGEDAQKAINGFAAATGATDEEVKAFNDTMLNIYNNNFGESFEDIANSMAQIKQQAGDIGAEELEEMTTNALMLRDTFDFEVNESMRAAKMLMDQFGLTGTEAYTLIAQGAQNGLDKNGDLLDSINEYGVHYSQMGYDAEEFFNSLKNGTEAGTFSVDKLGDAMKEFGIRTKDSSDSTAGAFIAIGVAAGDNSEAIEKTQGEIEKYSTKIEDLKKKLQYAQIEQAGFTDKTSELTRLKNADNIEKWSGELATLEQNLQSSTSALDAMESAAANGKQSTGDLFTRFAEGGDSAKEATQEVLQALFEMDDKVAQDAAGVALFGSMWEDLGIEGVKALTDVNGEFDATKSSLDEINAVKYNTVGEALTGLKRNLETSILIPISEQIMPKLNEFVAAFTEWLNDPETQTMLTELTDTLINLATNGLELVKNAFMWIVDNGDWIVAILAGIVAGFAAFKAVTMIQTAVTAFKALATAIQTTGLKQLVLNTIMSMNPVGLIVAAIAGLVAAFITLWNTSDEFREFWINLWEIIKKYAMIAWDAISGFFSGAWEKIKEIWVKAQPYFAAIWEGIKAVYAPIIEFFIGIFSGAWNGIKAIWEKVKPYFAAIWEGIKKLFKVVAPILGEYFKTAWENIKVVWDVVVAYFKMIWENIKLVFSVVKKVLSGDFKGAWEDIKKIWKNVAHWFGDVWIAIKKVFANVAGFFSGAFGDAWDAIKKAFAKVGEFFGGIWDTISEKFTSIGTKIGDAIGGAFKTTINAVLETVEDAINNVPRAINGALDLINALPGVEIDKLPEISLPRLATGGIVNGATTAIIGEDGREAVVPLEKNTEWMDVLSAKLADKMQRSGGGVAAGGNTTVTNNFYQTNNSPKALSRLDIYRQSRNLLSAKGV